MISAKDSDQRPTEAPPDLSKGNLPVGVTVRFWIGQVSAERPTEAPPDLSKGNLPVGVTVRFWIGRVSAERPT